MSAWAFTITAVTLAFELTGSPVWAGLASASQLAPQLLVAMASGRLADVRGEVLPIVAGGLAAGIPVLGMSVCYFVWGPSFEGSIYVLLVCAFLVGCGMALFAPAMQSIVPRLVTAEELSSAVSLNFLPMAVGRTVGPAGGAALLFWCGPAWTLLVLGFSFVLSSIAFLFVQVPRPAKVAGGRKVRAALAYVLRDRVIAYHLVAVAFIGACAEPVITLAPFIADSVGHHGGGGWIVAAFGLGGMFGVVAHRLAQRRLISSTEGYVAMLALGVLLTVSSVVHRLDVLLGLMVLAGCALVVGITAFSVAVQQCCRPEMLGRVMAMWMLAFVGSRPAAALIIGVVAEHLALWVAWVGSGALLVIATGVLRQLVRGLAGQSGARSGGLGDGLAAADRTDVSDTSSHAVHSEERRI